ncbi:tail fiber domain-containing protein [Sphingomonas sp. JC676]|uniref:tail fiber domain-containing protein n=1 Tax=Sphingomonas sp. JC676 TaxID=2768065 RepID=UPI001657A17E|nr:tail fiber domain-containing protein [Sphingomonas sp. JC676]MBC9030961.1 tail fiber domain-containing protein [Sphingomonas sp. JC676]
MSNPFQATRRTLLAALSGAPVANMALSLGVEKRTANLLSLPQARAQGPDGTIYPGARLYAYVTGSSEPAPIYRDAALATAHDNPVRADAEGILPPVFLDPAIIYRFVAKTSAGVAIPGMDLDPVSVSASGETSFSQVSDSAVARTIGAKLQDVSSVRDYGAVGDGRTQDKAAFTNAAAALTDGGALEVTAGVHLIGAQPFGPARGNVHAFDHAVVGDENIVANSEFTGSRSTGWELSNFVSKNPGISHAEGSIASAKCLVAVHAYTTYLISVTLNTTTAGGISFFLKDKPVFTAGDSSVVSVGPNTYQFAMFSYTTDGTVPFELRSDTKWAGSIGSILVIKIQREAPYDFFGISADKKDFDSIFGIKFGRFMSGNIAIGDRLTSALLSNEAAWNVALGSRALSTNIDGQENTAIGTFALEYNQSDRNTAGGYSAFRYNTKGTQNTGWGYKTFGRNSVGSNNTGVGFWASMYNQTGSDNSSFGSRAGYYNSRGNYNSAFGSQAGLQNDGGTANTYLGAIAGPYTPGPTTFSYSFSTCVGSESKGYGNNTTAVGCQARCGSDPNSGGTAITTAATAVGFRALAAEEHSVALGGDASANEIRSTALGGNAKATGPAGSAVGFGAIASANSTTVGSEAGVNLIGANNVSIGSGANNFKSATKYTNVTAIGYGAACTADDQIVLGNTSVKSIRAAVTAITALSDRRDKSNVDYIDGKFAAEFVKSLAPARWEWDLRTPVKREGGDIGFIAQDLLEAQATHNAEWLELVNDSNPDRLEATPGKLLPILVAALKSALERIEVLEGRQ